MLWRSFLATAAMLAACAGTRSESLPATIASTTTTTPVDAEAAIATEVFPSMETDAGAFTEMIGRLSQTGMDEQNALDAKTQAAFDALTSKGLTPDVITMFRAGVPKEGAATKTKSQTVDLTRLDGSL